MISAMSDASTAIVVWEFFPNTSTNILSNDERVCHFQVRKTINTPILVTTSIKDPIYHKKYGKKTMRYVYMIKS